MIEFEILEFCNKITATSSTTAKKAILAEYINNDEVKEFLKFLYDKNIVTGISTSKLNKTVNVFAEGYENLLDVLTYLRRFNTGTDSDIAVCQSYIDYVHSQTDNEELCTILKKTLTKSLKLGIDTKLVNTSIPNLIPVHEVQQAVALKNAKLKDNEWFCLSQKLNGNRATYVNGRILSRQGKEFTNIDHILNDLISLNKMFREPMVFDGEIIRKNVDNLSDNENFRIGTGILTSDAVDKTALGFVIFDVLPLSEFLAGESSLTYKPRMELMDGVIREYTRDLEHIAVVPFLYSGTDQTLIQKCLDQMDEEGKEGCMLARDVTYKCKRHNGLLKVKTFYTIDLKIVGFENGTGKNENTLCNVIVEYKDNTVGVGSGFTDEMRDWVWANRDSLLGRVIEVKYKEITHDKVTGKESLQFPVFVQFREEGKDVSYE